MLTVMHVCIESTIHRAGDTDSGSSDGSVCGRRRNLGPPAHRNLTVRLPDVPRSTRIPLRIRRVQVCTAFHLQ